jgi:hypothetical protein
MPPKEYSLVGLKIAKKFESLEKTHTPQQLLNNAVRLLLQSVLYTHNVDDWDRKPATQKIWTNLKAFVQEAYTCCLNATSIMTRSQGYIQCIHRPQRIG